jgi:MFS family permease
MFAVIALTAPPLGPLLAMVAIASLLATIFGPANRSAVPAFVSGERNLTSANAWMGAAHNLQLVVGPLLGGLFVDSLGLRGALGPTPSPFLVPRCCCSACRRYLPGTKPGDRVVS